MMEVVVTTGAIVVQSSSQIITTNKPTPSFFTGLKGKISHSTDLPQAHLGLQTLFLTINSSRYLGRGLP